MCEEKTAIGVAVTSGHKNLVSILVASGLQDEFVSPCSRCHQNIVEFGNLEVIRTKANRKFDRTRFFDFLSCEVTSTSIH
jgi:cytidine deaminase